MFDDLWEMWMDYVLLAPVKGTEREELDYDELYAELPEDKKTEYEQKRQELLELSGKLDRLKKHILPSRGMLFL